MSTNIEQELLQTFLKIREYKKQTSYYISLSFEKLYQLVVFQRDQYSMKEIIIKMFEFEENNEFIHIALISCVNKIFKYTIFDLQHLQEGEETWISPEAIVEILSKLGNVILNESTLDIYITKKLNLLKTILELPLVYISNEVFETVWNLLQICEQIPSIALKEQARDTIFFTVVQYIERVVANHNNDIERIDYILQILSSKINKFFESYNNTPQGKSADSIKAIEQPLQLLIFAIQQLKKNDLLNNHLQFIQRDFLYTLSKLSRLESVGIYSKILQAFEIIFECYKSGKIQDTIQTRFLFGQIIYLKLKQCLKKKDEKEITSEFLCLMNFLKTFLSDRENLVYIFQKNDFMIQNQPLLNEILTIIIDLSREKYDKDDFRYITAYSSDLLMGLLTYQRQNRDIEEQKVHNLYQIYQTNKQKWVDLYTIFNENPKSFLKKIASFKQVSDFKNLDETSIQQIVKFLRVYSDINQKHMIEILGGTEKFHSKCLLEYLKLFNFSQISILEATRVVFSTFLMTGETQQVLRFLEEYSNQYYENNKSLFLSSDSIYVYITAMMMLHSDLHNENNQNKMLPEQFINQGETKGIDLPKEFVLECFYDIQKDEIRECRNFHTSQFTTQIIWNYLESDKEFNNDTNKLSFIEPELEQIDNDEEMKYLVSEKAIFDMILSNIVENIDSIILKFLELDEESVSQFVDSLISLCIHNDKIEKIDSIFSNFYSKAKVDSISEQDDKSVQYLQCCFLLLGKAFGYIKEQRPLALKLLIKTTKVRSSLIKDSVAQRCNALIKKIRESNDFYNQNKHNSRSLLDIFSKFLEQEEQSDDEQEEKSIVVLQQRVPYEISSIYTKRFKNDNLTVKILEQTQVLDDKEYEDLINMILSEFNGYNVVQFSQKTHTFAHLIDLCIEIMKKNHDRVEKVWEKICILLKLGFSREKVDKKDPLLFQIDNEDLKQLIFTLNEMSILKKKKKTFLHSFSKFCLLELCITHMHLCDKFNSYDDCLQEGLNYLNDCSLQLVEEFNVQLNLFIASNKLFECRMSSYSQALKMFEKIIEVLNGKNMDKQEVIANCLTLKESLGNFALQLTNIQDDGEYVQILIMTMKLFEHYLKSKVFKVLDAELWALQLLQVLIITEGSRSNQIKGYDRQHIYFKTTGELNATLLQALLSLILCVKEWNQVTTEAVIKVMQRTILQIRYKYVSEELFKQIHDSIRLCQNKILLFKNEPMIKDYIQILSNLFLNWVNKERFTEIFLNPFIVSLAEIHKFAAENQLNLICGAIKSTIQEIITNLASENILKSDSISVQKCHQTCQKYHIQVNFHQIFNIPQSPSATQQQQQQQQIPQQNQQQLEKSEGVGQTPKFYSQPNLPDNDRPLTNEIAQGTEEIKANDQSSEQSQNNLQSNQDLSAQQQNETTDDVVIVDNQQQQLLQQQEQILNQNNQLQNQPKNGDEEVTII